MVSLVFSFLSGHLASWRAGEENRDTSSTYGTAETTLSLLRMKELMTLNSISSSMRTLTPLRRFQRNLTTGEEREDKHFRSC